VFHGKQIKESVDMRMMMLSPKTGFFVFTVLVAFILFLFLDLVNIHLPLIARYTIVLIALVLYLLVAGLKTKLNR
jgi:uncharacterized protein YqhQ